MMVPLQAGYGNDYINCEHGTYDYMRLIAPGSITNSNVRATANVPCTACPSA